VRLSVEVSVLADFRFRYWYDCDYCF